MDRPILNYRDYLRFLARVLLSYSGHGGAVNSVCYSADDRRLATGNDDGTVRIVETEHGQEVLVLRGHTQRVSSVSFSPDGRRLVTGGWDQLVKVWDGSKDLKN